MGYVIEIAYGISEVIVNTVERVLSGVAVRIQRVWVRTKSMEDKVSNVR